MSNDKYAVPEYPISRVRYYSGQFLKEDDFIAEESYHIAHQRRHERLLHVAGITDGLAVTLTNNATVVEVAPGSALDALGRQILLSEAQSINLDPTLTGTAYVEIAFAEEESHPADQNSTVQSNTRFSQTSTPVSIARTKTPGALTLATLSIISGNVILSSTERVYSGLRLTGPADAFGGGHLRSRGDAAPGWAELGCSLNVAGNTTLTGALGVTGASTFASASVTGPLSVTGATTLGAATVASASVTGNLAVAGASTFASAGVTGGLSVNGMSWLSAVNVTGAFTVNGQTTLLGTNVNGTLGVTGLATLGSASVTGTLGVNGQSTLASASVTGTLSVTGLSTLGNASVTGTLGVTGLATLGNTSVTGAFGVNGLATISAASVTGAFGVNGLATLAAASVTGAFGVNGFATLAAASVTGALGVNGLATLGSASVTSTLGVNGLLTASNGLTVGAGAITLAPLGANQAVFTNGSKQLATGTLSVPMGGTGATALTGVVKGNGAGAFSAMTGTTNQLARWTDANTIAASPMITDNGGAVGIGTQTPQTQLHVGGFNPVTRIESNGSGGWSEIDLYSTFPTAHQSKWNIAAQGTGPGGLAIRQFNDDRTVRMVPLYIDTSGNVGIGTGVTGLRGRLDLGYGGLNANLRIGDYLDIGETSLSNFFYMGVNAVLSTSNVSVANRFKPSYAGGSGMVLSQSAGGLGDLDFWGINWAGNAGEQDFPSAFAHVMRLGADGKVGIGTASPIAKLDIAQAARVMTHPTAVKGLYVTGDFGVLSDGVEFRHSNGTMGVGIGYGGIYATGNNANQDLVLKPRGVGRVVVQGTLAANNSRPITEQMVHRRIIYGYASQGRFPYDSGWREFNFCYGPFGYAIPPVQPGATRQYRLYVIYSDGMTTAGQNEIRFRLDDGSVATFIFDRTWGGGWNAAENRDCYTNWVPQPAVAHAHVEIRTTIAGTGGALHYAEIQAWDFFS